MKKQNDQLKHAIQQAEADLHQMKRTVEVQVATINALKDMRRLCVHQFSEPLAGYEHEGGQCELCGINELEALAHNIGAK